MLVSRWILLNMPLLKAKNFASAGRLDERVSNLAVWYQLMNTTTYCDRWSLTIAIERCHEELERNVWPGTVVGLEPHGDGVRVHVGGVPDASTSVLAEVTPAAVASLDLRPGTPVWVAVKASDVPDNAG